MACTQKSRLYEVLENFPKVCVCAYYRFFYHFPKRLPLLRLENAQQTGLCKAPSILRFFLDSIMASVKK